jgi:putative addiction module antidote
LRESAVREAAKEGESQGSVLRIRKIGNSAGVILPKDLMARLDLKEGDKLYVVDGAERGLKLTPYDPKHAKALEIARRSFRAYANTYKTLAK